MSKEIQKSGKHLGKTYRRNKYQFKNESLALAAVLRSHPKERLSNLTAQHSEKQFIWMAKTNFD